ncbi:MAG: chromate transporter [Victivallaceae bacterium]|nr:chromate transporter [Victivallaceae bacterium]
MIILHLFVLFLYFGCLCLSGGSSLLQFYIDELVYRLQWMTMDGLGNFLAISQMTPGPIGVNLATFIGYQRGGVPGGLAATVGLLTPSLILMSLAVASYNKWRNSLLVRSLLFGIKPVTVSLVITAFVATLGMSVFTDQLPLDLWMLKLCGLAGENVAAPLPRIRYLIIPLFGLTVYLLYRRNWSIFRVIFLSAALGAAAQLLLEL